MKFVTLMKSKSMLFSVLVSASAVLSVQAYAVESQTLNCEGEGLSVKVVLSSGTMQSLEVVKSSDAIVRQNIEIGAKGKIQGPSDSIDNQLPVSYEATFPSPSPQGLGAWTLGMSKDNSKAELDYDNDDGDMRAFSLVCTPL